MTLVISENISDQILKITLNDEQRLNAMSEQMALEFANLVSSLKEQIAANKIKPRVVILTGLGRAFSAGGDIKMLESKQQLNASENRIRMLNFYRSFLCLRELNIPLIAAINGSAIGAGLCIASACDIRVCAQNAKLGMTFTKLGLHPGMGATYFLPRLLGQSRATELMLTARIIDAEEALRIGLISSLVPDTEVMNRAISIAYEILACGPLASTQLLSNLREPALSLSDALEREAQAQSANYANAEFKEGIDALKEKRVARFS